MIFGHTSGGHLEYVRGCREPGEGFQEWGPLQKLRGSKPKQTRFGVARIPEHRGVGLARRWGHIGRGVGW